MEFKESRQKSWLLKFRDFNERLGLVEGALGCLKLHHGVKIDNVKCHVALSQRRITTCVNNYYFSIKFIDMLL